MSKPRTPKQLFDEAKKLKYLASMKADSDTAKQVAYWLADVQNECYEAAHGKVMREFDTYSRLGQEALKNAADRVQRLKNAPPPKTVPEIVAEMLARCTRDIEKLVEKSQTERNNNGQE